jgi:outer membrane translocation and assembly module TamA
MGLLDELIVLVKETIEEANQRNNPQPTAPSQSAPPQRSAEEVEALRRSLARRAAEMRQAEQQAEEHAAEQERQRQLAERERHQRKQAEAVHAAQVIHHGGAVDQQRILRLMRQPNALREMIVLREVLDKPLSLRRR